MATKYAKYAADVRDRALGTVGDEYPAGWCLRFCLSEIYGAPGIGDWDGDRAADAEDYAKAAAKADQLHSIESLDDIPDGALVLWTGGRNDHGHAAVSLGGGEIVSTDLPRSGRVGRVSISEPAERWGLKLAGYVTVAPTGHHLVKKAKTKRATPYRVTARSGLRGRTGPSKLTKTRTVRPFGAVIEAVSTATGGGLSWAVTDDGTHYALRYLKPV